MSQARSELARAIHARFGVEPRPFQLDLVQRTLGGASSLGIMPTGSGKSLAFQAAAALMPGTVLVISPLVSLMRDQVEKLRGLLRVARLDSTLPLEEARETLRALTAGQLDLLYVAPERLANERFQSALGRTRVAVLAVDEAHCISAWGHDFRPDYLRLALLRADLGGPPVLALTATAPPAVREDIRASLAIPVDGVINTGARRPNLILRVEVPLDRERRLLELAMARPEAPTIVYALRQADTEALAQVLDGAGVRAAAYHAGLSPEERASVQDRFLRDDLACVVATIAFGMGVDKPNVRRVFHLHAPRSLEGYIQEVGRAGRDGAPAEIALLYAEDDIAALANFVDAKVPSEERVRAALNAAFAARESADVLAFSPQTIGDQHDLDPAAVRTLFARLELRGVVRAITPAFDTYQLPIDHDAVGAAARLGEPDGTRWRALVANARRGRTWLTLSVSEHSAAAGLSLEAARRLLWRLEEEGLAPARASGVLQRYRVLRRPDRATDGPALLESVRQGVEAEHRRLEAVRAYVLERGCRQSHALAYLGDADTSACGTCDLCQGAAPIEPEALRRWDWRSEFDASVVDSLAEIETDPVGMSRALCQVSTPRSRPYRRHPAWGALERAPYADVLSLVECRIKGLVSAESKP
ncbi:MAG TPA: RecQ family ATP-dependent DNA helicase [Chloroflexota bacterium]|nr:RecQ family ATP-dependent DNA helicase [Chloroflexota bacterium]